VWEQRSNLEGMIMKMVQKLSLIAMAITLAACNEKVSPELQQGAAVDTPTGGGPTVVPTEYYFKLTNTAPLILNYKLHKTGPGNMSAACEVRSTSKLTNDNFRASPALNDISCFLEAEELSLQAGGLSFQIEASPNTCEFIEYSPFSYFNRIPGDSTSMYTRVSCMNDDTTNAHADTAATNASINIDYDSDGAGPAVAGPTGCETYLNQNNLLATTKQPFSISEDETEAEILCRYNYTDGGNEKCDIGEVTIQDLQVTFDTALANKNGEAAGRAALTTDYSDSSDDDGGGPDDGTSAITEDEATAITNNFGAAYGPAFTLAYNSTPPKHKVVTRKIKCGGAVANCVGGPLKDHSGLSSTRGSIILTSEFDKVMTYKQEYKDLLPDGPSNYHYANFRRDLANVNIAYGDSTHTEASPYSAMYTSAFASNTFGKVFDPNIMERYSRGIVPNNSAYLLDANYNGDAPFSVWEQNSMHDNKFVAKPLAMEPFVGMRELTSTGALKKEHFTNPYYTFYCLDQAYDRKARIRLAVRDWDRIFPTNDNLEWLSDIFSTDARQDLQYAVEDPDSNDDINDFNDIWDWDDMVWTVRDDTTPLIFYRPAPTLLDGDGFFNSEYFPEYSK
jgi:hypothetical protein